MKKQFSCLGTIVVLMWFMIGINIDNLLGVYHARFLQSRYREN